MNPLFTAAEEVQFLLNEKKIKFCFIGGLALIRWGEIRVTNDIDIIVTCGFGNEENIIKIILDKFKGRIKDAYEFAKQNRVLLVTASNGTPFEDSMIERASYFHFLADTNLITCSAEDLIITKAFANRPKDWLDIEGIISRQKGNLNKDLIFTNLSLLVEAKEDTTIISKLHSLF
jgi:hypothetical protein